MIPRPHHEDTVSKGLNKLMKIKSELEGKEKELKHNIDNLFCKTKLKDWATEQYDYSKSKLKEVDKLMQDVDAKSEVLSLAKIKLSKVLKGIKRKDKQAKKIKQNKKKAEKRKAKRLENSILFLKSKLIKVDSLDKLDDCITKDMLQIEQLETLRRDRHQKALTKLLENYNWHADARKCVIIKLTEWALIDQEKKAKEEEEEDELEEDMEDLEEDKEEQEEDGLEEEEDEFEEEGGS